MQIGPWRATYTPGSWVLLAGPTSMLVMQPANAQHSELINNLWEDILGATDIGGIAERLAAFGLAQMPSLGVFFWDEGEMRAMVRGEVQVVDSDTEETVADGTGVRTWSEVSLGSGRRFRVRVEPEDGEQRLQLPLVVGGAQISALELDATSGVVSVQANAVAEPGVLAEAEPAPAPEADAEQPPAPVAAPVAPLATDGPDVALESGTQHLPVAPPERGEDRRQIEFDRLDPTEPMQAAEVLSPGEDSPAEDSPAEDSPVEDQTESDQSASDQSASDQSVSDQSVSATEDEVSLPAAAVAPRSQAAIGSDTEILAAVEDDDAPPSPPSPPNTSGPGSRREPVASPNAAPQAPYNAPQAVPGTEPMGLIATAPGQSQAVPNGPAERPASAALEQPPATDEPSEPLVLDRLDLQGPDDPAQPPPVQSGPFQPDPAPPGQPPAQPEPLQPPDQSAPIPLPAQRGDDEQSAHPEQESQSAQPEGLAQRGPEDQPAQPERPPQPEPSPQPPQPWGQPAQQDWNQPTPPAQPGPSGVLTAFCARSHPNPPEVSVCRRCGAPVDRASARPVPQPAVALLRPTGEAPVPVTRDVVIGRSPKPQGDSVDPVLLTVRSPSHDISRTHLSVTADGWRLMATDLHSTNGTLLVRANGQSRERLTPGEAVPVEIGCVLDLGDGVSILIDHP